MITKNIQLSGEDLVKKHTGLALKKKDTQLGNLPTYADDLKLLHQLQLLNFEMEMQQEQKHIDQDSPENIDPGQAELFESSPSGCFALNTDGIIQEVNLAGASLLGTTRAQLTHQFFVRYIVAEDQDTFHSCWHNMIHSNDQQKLNVSLIKPDGQSICVRITMAGFWVEGEFFVLLSLTDITMWKHLDDVHSFLMDSYGSKSGKDFFNALTEYLHNSLRMDYVSVDRLMDDAEEAEIISAYPDNAVKLNLTYKPADRAIGKLLDRKSFCFPRRAHHLFPNDSLLQQLNAESYAGTILWGSEGKPVGLIELIGQKTVLDLRTSEIILKQVSVRAAAELEQLQLKDANEKLRKEIIVRQQQEHTLKEAIEKYRTVADYTYNWETWLNHLGEYIYVSPSCHRITGYTVEEFMQDRALLTRITHPEDRPVVEEYFTKAITEKMHHGPFEFRIISRDGHERWIGHHSQPVFDAMGNFMGQRGSNQDITQKKVAEKILLDSQKHLRQLSQRMEEITEAERTRISREIHDELGHLLSALKYDIEGLSNQSDLTEEYLKGELEVMVDMIDSLIDSVRKIATELRPGILDHLGLFPAIEWQIKQFRLRTKMCCSFSMEEMEINFDKNETNIIFRILQEILTNITRHAHATHVRVLLSKTDSHFMMEVTDNGVGFQYDDYLQVNTLGLIGMKERALSIGGEIQIDSKPGKGTIVRFLLPRS